jgi:hypothetical protein
MNEIEDVNPDELLMEIITEHLKGRDDIDLTLAAPIRVSGKRSLDGGYRSYSLLGSETFVFSGMRRGKRNSYIFELQPVDAREYSSIEFEETTIFKAFPFLEEVMIDALCAPSEDTTTNAGEATQAMSVYRADMDTFIRAAAKFRNVVRKFDRNRKKSVEVLKKKEVENFYKDDPLWGAV